MPVPRNAPVAVVYVSAVTPQGFVRYDLGDRLLEFDFDDNTRKVCKLKLRLNNWDLYHLDNPFWDKNTQLRVQWGYPGQLSDPRIVRITKISGAKELSIEGLGRLSLLNTLSKARTWNGMTNAQVLQDVAVEYGFGVGGGDPVITEAEDLDPEAKPQITQVGVTDDQFLRRMASEQSCDLYEAADGLHCHRPNFNQAPIRVLTWYIPPGVGEIMDWSIENDILSRPGEVTIKGVHPGTGQPISSTAKQSDTPRSGDAPRTEIVERRLGVSNRTQEVQFSSHTRPDAVRNESEARRKASADVAGTQLTGAKLSLTCVGDPGLVVGKIIQINGLGEKMSGRYYIRGARQLVTGGGHYTTKLMCRRDGVNTGGQVSGADRKDPAAGDPNALQRRLRVDERTNETRTDYVPGNK